MATLRFQALKEALNREIKTVEFPSTSCSEYFAINVFDKKKMQKYLSKDVFHKLINAIEQGANLDRKIADQIATGMKSWALERGATHYTHWFHPLTDSTAEKHDSFLELTLNEEVFESFDGSKLVQQEPDASSLPTGGIRNTFEARGYTAWDPSSPAFIVNKTLCIPTIFISYTGEALDYKTPLLRSLSVLDKYASEVSRYFDADVKKVITTLGWEQEYFLIDEALYNARPDLVLTGRTLLGHASAKDQQLQDHYFGSIPQRVEAFMQEAEIESYKLGIPLKTRHNEVAPNQFECASIFQEANLAVDQNLLAMEILRRVARKHKLRIIYHEKPFKGINGSAKHSNWSLATDTGVNLLKPGKNPKSNLQFLTFLVNTMKAVYDYSDLLRASIVSAGNEYRLGANEAPPAIISVFLGSKLSKILDDIEKRIPADAMTPNEKTEIKLDIGRIPEILLDNTDRNRTSPFAFTGNRFEFRAVGSSGNSAASMIVLNTAVANQLKIFIEEVEKIRKKGFKKDEAILKVLRKTITASKPVVFEGNGYSNDWVNEAKKRGLTNIKSVQEALKAYLDKKSIELFENHGVLTKKELIARYEVKIEKYKKQLQIESRVLGDIVLNHIVPTIIQYQNLLIENVKGLKEIFNKDEFEVLADARIDIIRDISLSVSTIKLKSEQMRLARKKANNLTNCESIVIAYAKEVKPFFEQIREYIDSLERIVDNELWPLPKYREILFTI
ncbi:MAG: glutamine synthetase III [Bacteroidales bacterium]|nr:glutamine synthetase III [Bacteroidales bacterium]